MLFMENIKPELPELSRKFLNKDNQLDLKKLDTKIILNHASELSSYLRTVDLNQKIEIKKMHYMD
jgi:hypothetical protein